MESSLSLWQKDSRCLESHQAQFIDENGIGREKIGKVGGMLLLSQQMRERWAEVTIYMARFGRLR